jgi:hypothetical protein
VLLLIGKNTIARIDVVPPPNDRNDEGECPMDQREGDFRRDIEDRRAAMTEKVGMVVERAQETMGGVKSTINQAMAGFKQVQDTVEGTKSAADRLIESVKLTVDETAERVNSTADLLHQVRQSPWIMLGGAILLGYILGSIAREASSAPGRIPDRSRAHDASVHDGHELSETYGQPSAYPTAVMPCSTCGQMVHQADKVGHSAGCTGQRLASQGRTP